ncbi:Protein zyg-11 B [Blattella germanica]|nr:Protein zyg-11 B [Blattella germanica]
MYDSPRSLQEACMDFICENLEALCEVTPVLHHQGLSAIPVNVELEQLHNSQLSPPSPACANAPAVVAGSRLSFRDGEVYFHSDLSEKLLTMLSEKGKLSDLTMTLFETSTTRLRHVQLRNARALTTRGLRVLKGHKILDLEATGMKVTVNDLIGCLGEWTLQNLRSLNVARSTFMDDGSRYCVVVALSKLRNLQSLNVSCTEFNRHGLEIVAEDLPQLESLDISCTRVDDISPLRKCKDRLKSLTIISDLLKAEDCMVHLSTLDISGKDEINIPDLRHFIGCHRELKFLGLIHSEACYDESFINPHHPDYNSELVVTGIATEAQLLEALRRYTHRPIYIQKCLYNLFRLTPNFGDARVDVIKLVLPGMEAHPGLFGVQMAATACLYNLTKGELAQKIHPKVLKQVVELTLTAMEKYPNHYQLHFHKNLFYDIQDCLTVISFHFFYIHTAKISTSETSLLGAHPQYMRKLLSIVRSKVQTSCVDITIKFTLNESPTTCSVFLEEGGMDLFLDVLVTFQDECAVETKVLGLINNIAEVSQLRPRLMVPGFMTRLRKLLHSGHIDVSYFAAGIIAHLASDGADTWIVSVVTRQQLLQELGEVVVNWETPEGEMVAYRSFHPFFPLLTCHDAFQVQLWAVWAIQHVCTKNAKRYCPMLVEEGGSVILRHLHDNEEVDASVRAICRNILDVLVAERYSPDVW